jgi:hypothetical protein
VVIRHILGHTLGTCLEHIELNLIYIHIYTYMIYKRKGGVWGNLQCFNFFCNGIIKVVPSTPPRVMAHWYSPLWDLGITKGHGFKPSGV